MDIFLVIYCPVYMFFNEGDPSASVQFTLIIIITIFIMACIAIFIYHFLIG